MINYENPIILDDNKVSQNIKKGLNILWTTPTGTVVLDRDFGIDMNFVDMPILLAKQMYTVEVVTKTKKYEPRVIVENIVFETDATNGKLIPKIKIREA